MKTSLSKVWAVIVATALLTGIASRLSAQSMEITDSRAMPVVVETASISTEVTGRLAVTTFDLVFRNPNQRVLEGTFVFPLLDGQSIVQFALDIGGAMREAVPVDKVRGRVIFEEIERRQVDPGLIEKTAGNNYRARIYPIPSGGTRRIIVAYQEDIARAGSTALYRLNLSFTEPLKKFRLGVLAHTGGSGSADARTTLDVDLPAWRDGQFLEIEREHFTARGMLELRMPPANRPAVVTGKFGPEEYFYAEVPVPTVVKSRTAPRTIGLLWDSSGSGGDRDHARELALLDSWFALVHNVEVRLVRFRDTVAEPMTFAVRDGDWAALRRELETTAYDGATSLADLADDPSIDEWLLFSDGLMNFGKAGRSGRLHLRSPVHVILGATRADSAWLRGIAHRHGGEFVDLTATDASRGAARLRLRSPRVIAVDYGPGEASQVFPEAGTAISGDVMVVTGILRAKNSQVRLRVGHDEVDTVTVGVAVRSRDNESRVASRAWAAAKIESLAMDPDANREDMRQTSRDFGIVTADTSLIVLETVADYVRYDIAPPDELRKEWNAARLRLTADRRKNDGRHIDDVARRFQERVAWWSGEFPKTRPERERIPDSNSRIGATSEQARPTASAGEVVQLSAFVVQAERDGNAGAMASASTASALVMPALRPMMPAEYTGQPVASTMSPTGGLTVASAPSEPALPVIAMRPWTAGGGYLDRLRRAGAGRAYAVYLEERVRRDREPGFFLEVANWFFDEGDAALGVRILSNLAELELEDVALLRVLAHRLQQLDRPELALPLFERVLALRPDEPQSRRDLALVNADLKNFQRAVDLLWEVVSDPSPRRFADIEIIALTELNAIAATAPQPLDLSRVDSRLIRNLPVGTRVVLTWDANDCDIDLLVTDPLGETAFYQNSRTYQGGFMSKDITIGYGPEEFVLRDPAAGIYRVQIHYFADQRQTLLGPVTAQVRLITGFGTSDQKEQRHTVRLDTKKTTLDVGIFTIAPPKQKVAKK